MVDTDRPRFCGGRCWLVLSERRRRPRLDLRPLSGDALRSFDARSGGAGSLTGPPALDAVTVAGDALAGTHGRIFSFEPQSCIIRFDITNVADGARSWATSFGPFTCDSAAVATRVAVGPDRAFLGVGSSVYAFARDKPAQCEELEPGFPVRRNGLARCPPCLKRRCLRDPRYLAGDASAQFRRSPLDGRAVGCGHRGTRRIVAPPTVGDGWLYVTTNDGAVFRSTPTAVAHRHAQRRGGVDGQPHQRAGRARGRRAVCRVRQRRRKRLSSRGLRGHPVQLALESIHRQRHHRRSPRSRSADSSSEPPTADLSPTASPSAAENRTLLTHAHYQTSGREY